eukprot:2872574-Pleurochrysis_carterae.AAC.1
MVRRGGFRETMVEQLLSKLEAMRLDEAHRMLCCVPSLPSNFRKEPVLAAAARLCNAVAAAATAKPIGSGRGRRVVACGGTGGTGKSVLANYVCMQEVSAPVCSSHRLGSLFAGLRATPQRHPAAHDLAVALPFRCLVRNNYIPAFPDCPLALSSAGDRPSFSATSHNFPSSAPHPSARCSLPTVFPFYLLRAWPSLSHKYGCLLGLELTNNALKRLAVSFASRSPGPQEIREAFGDGDDIFWCTFGRVDQTGIVQVLQNLVVDLVADAGEPPLVTE